MDNCLSIKSIAAGTSAIKPVECAGNLAAWFENHMSMLSEFVFCGQLELFLAKIPSGK